MHELAQENLDLKKIKIIKKNRTTLEKSILTRNSLVLGMETCGLSQLRSKKYSGKMTKNTEKIQNSLVFS